MINSTKPYVASHDINNSICKCSCGTLIRQLSGQLKYAIAGIDSNIIAHRLIKQLRIYSANRSISEAKWLWIGMEIYLKEGQSD